MPPKNRADMESAPTIQTPKALRKQSFCIKISHQHSTLFCSKNWNLYNNSTLRLQEINQLITVF